MTEEKDKALQVLVQQEVQKLLSDPRRAIRLYAEALQESEEKLSSIKSLKRKIELKRQLIVITEFDIKVLEDRLRSLLRT